MQRSFPATNILFSSLLLLFFQYPAVQLSACYRLWYRLFKDLSILLILNFTMFSFPFPSYRS